MKTTDKLTQKCDLCWSAPRDVCLCECVSVCVCFICACLLLCLHLGSKGWRGQRPVILDLWLAFVTVLTRLDWLSNPAVKAAAGMGGSTLCSVARLQVYPIDVEIERSSKDYERDGCGSECVSAWVCLGSCSRVHQQEGGVDWTGGHVRHKRSNNNWDPEKEKEGKKGFSCHCSLISNRHLKVFQGCEVKCGGIRQRHVPIHISNDQSLAGKA